MLSRAERHRTMGPPLSKLKWDARALQRKLKALGVAPPPPKGKAVLRDIMKPGAFYVPGATSMLWAEYLALLERTLAAATTKWTPDAWGHNVLMAALEAAPIEQRLERPHGHVAARPIIDNLGYLRVALFAADSVAHLVTAGDRKSFQRWVEIGRRVEKTRKLTARDHAVLNTLPSDGPLPALRVAEGVALEAGETGINNVGGKGARSACAEAVRLLAPTSARPFLEHLDALILREAARVQFENVVVQPSARVIAARWRGAEKGKGTHWLVELENGRHALLWKLKGKWRLVEGSREDVLACVEDAHLRAATDALLGAKRPSG